MEQQQFGEPREEGLFEESINLRHYWHIVLERRWLVVATFAVVMVLCLFYLFTATSIFSATTRLQIDNETENSMRMESFVMEGMQGQDYLQTQYKNLQSRSLMKTVLLETQQNARILEGIKFGKRTPSQLGRYFEAELKVAKNPEFEGKKGIPTHDSMGFDHEPTEAEVKKSYADWKPHLIITEILSINDASLATEQVEQRLQQMAIAGFFGPTFLTGYTGGNAPALANKPLVSGKFVFPE